MSKITISFDPMKVLAFASFLLTSGFGMALSLTSSILGSQEFGQAWVGGLLSGLGFLPFGLFLTWDRSKETP